MRLWRNRQTRTFEGRMGNHPGSSPGNRTNYSKIGPCKGSVFFIIWNSWCGYRARSPDDAAGRRHPLHAIGRTTFRVRTACLANNRCKTSPGTGRVHLMTPQGGDIRCTRLGERLFGSELLASPTIAVRQVPVTGRVHRMMPQGGDIRCTRLGEQLFGSELLASPTIAERQVPEPGAFTG